MDLPGQIGIDINIFFKPKSVPITDQYLCLARCLINGKQVASFSLFPRDGLIGRQGTCLIASIFGEKINCVSCAILKVLAERPLIHSKFVELISS